MSLLLDLQIATEDISHLPVQQDFEHWVALVLQHQVPIRPSAELTIRIVDIAEIQLLNQQYRHKNVPTNVLSFPFELPEGFAMDIPLLGDIIICKQVVEQEAQLQQKPLISHWAHLTIHGCLHLLGFDHIEDSQAEQMESLETKIMSELGYANPYLATL